MSSRPIWMPLYVGDYLRDTRHLTTLEHGAYLLLIMEYWSKGRLPTDDKNLRKICEISPYLWRRHRSVLAALFGPGWRHERIEQELKKANELRLKRAVYGARGGRVSRGRDNGERSTVVNWPPSKR
jgi:uncharacterized protein YdaU (DUF1376 family)